MRAPPRTRPAAVARLLAAVALVAVALLAASPAGAGTAPGYETCTGAQADAQVAVGPAGTDVVPAGVAPVLPPGAVPVLPESLPGELVRAYRIDLALAPDGDVRVVEAIDYDFGAAQRHGIFRDLITTQRCDDRYDRRYPITDLSVVSPTGAPADWSLEDGETGQRIRIGDPDVFVTGPHTYVIDYTLGRVANPFDDHVELYWNVVGTAWVPSLVDVGVTVRGPAPPLQVDCFVGPTGSTRRCGAMAVVDGVAAFAQGELDPGEGMTVVVAYPPEAFDLGPPVLEERWSLARAFEPSPAVVGTAVALAALLLGGLALVGFRVGRDRQAVGSHVDVAFADGVDGGTPVPLVGADRTEVVELVPPERLRPAQCAVLLDERVGARDVAATLVDLAVRGYLRIEQVGEGREEDHRLVWLGKDPAGLLQYEQKLLDWLFEGRSAVLLSEKSQTFKRYFDGVVDLVYADAAEHGWFVERPDRVRRRWRALGIVALAASAGLLAALMASTHVALLGVPPLLVSLVLVVLAGRFPRRTPRGTGLTRRVAGFRVFIEDSEAPRARWAEQRSIFTDYLPYAMAFDCADRWARTFAPLGAEAVAAGPAFYVGTHAFDPDGLVRATDRFEASAATALTSVPPSSSGSSGFSGGGSSGGGGGGGGGGSW